MDESLKISLDDKRAEVVNFKETLDNIRRSL